MEDIIIHTKFWLENLKGRDNSEDLGIHGKMLEWILGNTAPNCGLDSTASGQGLVMGSCEHGNKSSGGSIKGGELND
jgi:hypothetical protein